MLRLTYVLGVLVATALGLVNRTQVKEVDVCGVVTEWIDPTRGESLNGHEVDVLQDAFGGWARQFFYSARCSDAEEGRPCQHIENGLKSRCETRFNFVPAMTVSAEGEVEWNMLKIPGQCVCVLETPKLPTRTRNIADLFGTK